MPRCSFSRTTTRPAVFATAATQAYGWQVAWLGTDLSLSADGLWEDAHPCPKSPGWMSPEAFADWMDESRTFAAAAQALDVSPRMLKCYAVGTHAVPKTVSLACMHIASPR